MQNVVTFNTKDEELSNRMTRLWEEYIVGLWTRQEQEPKYILHKERLDMAAAVIAAWVVFEETNCTLDQLVDALVKQYPYDKEWDDIIAFRAEKNAAN